MCEISTAVDLVDTIQINEYYDHAYLIEIMQILFRDLTRTICMEEPSCTDPIK